jgi:hypothetical protein
MCFLTIRNSYFSTLAKNDQLSGLLKFFLLLFPNINKQRTHLKDYCRFCPVLIFSLLSLFTFKTIGLLNEIPPSLYISLNFWVELVDACNLVWYKRQMSQVWILVRAIKWNNCCSSKVGRASTWVARSYSTSGACRASTWWGVFEYKWIVHLSTLA